MHICLQAYYLAQSLSISPDLTSVWSLSISLSPSSACQPDNQLKSYLRQTILDSLKSAGVSDVKVNAPKAPCLITIFY